MIVAGLLLAMAAQQAVPPDSASVVNRAVVVASKPFGESFLLMEMFAQLLEARGVPVDRRPYLGATEIAFQALRTGAIDVYPEYTGTGLLAILDREPLSDPQRVYAEVSREFPARFDTRWLPPLGFENTYAIAVRRGTADSLRLATLSDLAERGRTLTAGFTADFIGRPDGLPGLRAAYGIDLPSVRALLQAVKYQALASGDVDLIDGYSTDGFIARYDLVVLRDDRRFFPPYQAAALVNGAFARAYPAAVSVLAELSGRITEEMMRGWNRRLENDGDPVAAVATDALGTLGLIATSGREAEETMRSGSLLGYLWAERFNIVRHTGRHLLLVSIALLAGIVVAVPLGLSLERRRAAAEPVIRIVGLLQTIPSIALLAFMIPLLGIGVVPALVALFLYSLFPIVRNTFTGVRDADPGAVRAATALGMTPRQVLGHIRLPLAAPVLMAGIRTAAVITIGTATLAAFIGAGGLGEPIVAGLALSDSRMILSGALPAALLALVVDRGLALVERRVKPGGV
jgi:osmoprotectant transport system permease protein